jgi:cytochrome b
MSTAPLSTETVARDHAVQVWDPLVRIFHWTLVVAFFVAYFSEDVLPLHVWAGYLVGGLVVLRLIWGFIGPKHARFSDFIYGPFWVWGYLLDLLRLRGTRYIGHSPAGGAMVIVLLVGLAAVVGTGLQLYAIEENAGPLAGISGSVRVETPSPAPEVRGERREEPAGERFWEEMHEVLANVTLVLVILHVGGVVLASVVHRENLARAMLTGRKRAD